MYPHVFQYIKVFPGDEMYPDVFVCIQTSAEVCEFSGQNWAGPSATREGQMELVDNFQSFLGQIGQGLRLPMRVKWFLWILLR